jgi:YegS/Rv2252/BmrU family lipid kinase
MDVVPIFANPIAGRGQGRRIAERIAAALAAAGFEPRTIYNRPDSVADDVIGRDAVAAIAIGGDGTIRGVTRRLFENSPQGPPLLIVPMGTANLLGQHLGIKWNDRTLPQEVTRAIQQRRTIDFDVARANGELFLLIGGVGIDAVIVHELDKIRKGPISMTSYVLPAMLGLGFYRYPPIEVFVDDRRVFGMAPGMAFIGNIPEYGTGFPILPHAKPDDGVLDVCVLPCRDRNEALRLAMHAAAGEHLHMEGVVYVKGERVRIRSTEPVPVQLDGDAAGHTPLDIDLLRARVPFIVPA